MRKVDLPEHLKRGVTSPHHSSLEVFSLQVQTSSAPTPRAPLSLSLSPFPLEVGDGFLRVERVEMPRLQLTWDVRRGPTLGSSRIMGDGSMGKQGG